MRGTSIWHSNKHGDCEIDADITSVYTDEIGDTYVIFQWDCPQLGWNEYRICFTHDNKFVLRDYACVDEENLPFLGAILQSLLNKNEENVK